MLDWVQEALHEQENRKSRDRNMDEINFTNTICYMSFLELLSECLHNKGLKISTEIRLILFDLFGPGAIYSWVIFWASPLYILCANKFYQLIQKTKEESNIFKVTE